MEKRARTRLSREDWVDAALEAIAEGGLAAVAVVPLAKQLGATKGSFYWHFPSREALIEAALAAWEQTTTSAVIAEIEAASQDPRQQLRLLFKRVTELAARDRIELARRGVVNATRFDWRNGVGWPDGQLDGKDPQVVGDGEEGLTALHASRA